MKIIKEGQLPELDIFKGTCIHCKSVIEAERHELKANNDGRNGTDYIGPCEFCKKTMWFNKV